MTSGIDSAALRQLISHHLPSTFPALSICVIHKGETILHDAWGWIDPDTRQLKVTPNTLFDLASVSKLFVEVSFLSLVEAGAISLESRLVDVIPEFGRLNPRPIAGGQDPHTRRMLPLEERFRALTVDPTAVTFKHLLTHTSGLAPWRSVYLLAAAEPPPPPTLHDNYDAERWRKGLAAMLEFPFAGTIGDTIRYTDIGIMLLGEAVARLSLCRLDRAISRHILSPLGLASITYNPVLNGIAREQIVPTEYDDHWRYRRAWGEVHDENACGVGGIAGHAGLFATTRDLARFGCAWLSGDPRLPVGDELETYWRRHSMPANHSASGWAGCSRARPIPPPAISIVPRLMVTPASPAPRSGSIPNVSLSPPC